MNIMSSFTYTQVLPNLYEFLMLNTKEVIFQNMGYQAVDTPL